MRGPSVVSDSLVFTLDDPDRTFGGVGLDCDDVVAGPRRFRRTGTGWRLAIPRPDLSRLEYRLVVTHRGGTTEVICDPGNSDRVSSPFGDRSVALMPDYELPQWVRDDGLPGEVVDVGVHSPTLGRLPLALWSPASLEPTCPAHLLVVHDGPAYLELAALGEYVSAMAAADVLPPFRLACMHPLDRDTWYAANDDYVAAELAALDELTATVPTVGPWATLGASLGGLTSVLLALTGGERFGAVLAQSGSFFTPELDPQESSYPRFDAVVERVARVTSEHQVEHPLRVALTCGQLEENYANNHAMATALAGQGHLVKFRPVRDLHNFTAWRDALDPALTDLLRGVWRPGWLAA